MTDVNNKYTRANKYETKMKCVAFLLIGESWLHFSQRTNLF